METSLARQQKKKSVTDLLWFGVSLSVVVVLMVVVFLEPGAQMLKNDPHLLDRTFYFILYSLA